MKISRLDARLRILALALGVLCLSFTSTPAPARGAEEFAATLSAPHRKLFEDYLAAQTLFEFKTDAYWREVSDKRAVRRAKKRRGEALTRRDYIRTFPPRYQGPELTADLAKRWNAYQDRQRAIRKEEPPKPLPGLADYLANSRTQYGFIPEQVPEREFKLRYAREAMALGLTKEQVVRVYALETGGLGTADMVAGIHPIKKTGTPISTALGYAQLLAANSTDELVKHGPRFIDRLGRMAARERDPQRRGALTRKAERLRAMLAAARSIPHEWRRHVAFARTPKGLGIHAINLDGDIGPWLQVVKLYGLKEMAEKAGIAALTGAEIELMNLAGPATGLEMMSAAGQDAPTPNFFERGAYARNTIVRDKTAKELLIALDKRMDQSIKKPGAIEFADVFDELMAERRIGQN